MAYEVNDVSFAGSSITVGGVTVRDFMDDTNPVEFQDVEVSGVGINLNGDMIRYAKPSPIVMSVTVIPGTPSDDSLYGLWKKYRIGPSGNAQWSTPLTCKLNVANNKFKVGTSLSSGTMLSGPAGMSVTGEGKMQGRTYTFAFAKAD